MRSILWFCLSLMLLAVQQSVLGAGATLPFGEGFEGAVNANFSSVGSDASATVISSGAIESSKAIRVASNDYTLAFDTSANYQKAWVQTYAKVAPYDDAGGTPDVGAATVAFYVNTDGIIKAKSGANWLAVTNVGTAGTNAWFAFVAQLDYTAETWNLYLCNNGTFGQELLRCTNTVLDFSSGATETKLTSLVVDTDRPAVVDAVAATEEYQAFADADGARLRSIKRTAKRATQTALPPYAYSNADENKLNNKLGWDLAKGLADNNGVYFTDPASGVTKGSTVTSGTWGGGNTTVAIPVGAAVRIDRIGSTMDTYAFYAYDSLPNNASVTVLGTDNSGWTGLYWPWSAASAGQASWFSAGPDSGDRIWIYNETTKIYTTLQFDGTNWKQVGQAGAWGGQLAAGQAFWYQRSASDDFTWTP